MTMWEVEDVEEAFEGFVSFLPMLKVLFALVVGFAWSGVLKFLSGKAPKDPKGDSTYEVAWWKQHTTPMYIIFLVTLLCELLKFSDELKQTIFTFDELNTTQPAGLQEAWVANLTASEFRGECLASWDRDQALYSEHAWIQQLASLAPIFASITFVVNCIATIRHTRKEKRCMWDRRNRGATLWILQLPVVYSLTALYSVAVALRQARQGAYLCAEELRSGTDGPGFFIEAGLSFGDGYEAIALLLFADITMNVIEHVVDLVVTDAESVKHALTEMEKAVDDKLQDADKDAVKKEFHELAGHNNTVMTRLEQMSEKLVHSTWSLSTLGIQYFAFTCFAIAIPQIVACQSYAWGFPDTFKSFSGFSDSWSATFKGCGLLGSCVAIHNMVSIEQNFEANFLHGFEAKAKFVSVKIMVSIVFFQQMALPYLFNLTTDRALLFDATLRIIEFTFISIFNLKAWPLDQDFYGMEALDMGDMEDLKVNLLEDGKLGHLQDELLKMDSQKQRE